MLELFTPYAATLASGFILGRYANNIPEIDIAQCCCEEEFQDALSDDELRVTSSPSWSREIPDKEEQEESNLKQKGKSYNKQVSKTKQGIEIEIIEEPSEQEDESVWETEEEEDLETGKKTIAELDG